jgi:hypothetical protein
LRRSSETYALPERTTKALEALVDKIEANPGQLIRPAEVEACPSDVDMAQLAASLPEGLSEDDLVGILKLALLTECATESYGDEIQECATRFDAAWLARFNAKVWVPDELTHHLPYKKMLLDLGFSEAELDREIKDTQQRRYVHYGGPKPIHMTTFAMIQELLTDTYHGLIANLLRPTAPLAASMVMQIKRRETLHAVWYRDMTALQIEANPEFVAEVAEQANQFEMPSLSLVPDLHEQGMRWQHSMGAEPEQIIRTLLRYVHEAFGDARLTGELVVRLAAAQKVSLGPLPAAPIQAALNRLGGPGYGLVGEAVLERIGLGYMFAAPSSASSAYQRVRALMRSWLAGKLPDPATVGMRMT